MTPQEPATEKKMTVDDLFEMFGGELPKEAYALVFEGPGDITIGEMRNRLTAMAEQYAAIKCEPVTQVDRDIYLKYIAPDYNHPNKRWQVDDGSHDDNPAMRAIVESRLASIRADKGGEIG